MDAGWTDDVSINPVNWEQRVSDAWASIDQRSKVTTVTTWHSACIIDLAFYAILSGHTTDRTPSERPTADNLRPTTRQQRSSGTNRLSYPCIMSQYHKRYVYVKK